MEGRSRRRLPRAGDSKVMQDSHSDAGKNKGGEGGVIPDPTKKKKKFVSKADDMAQVLKNEGAGQKE